MFSVTITSKPRRGGDELHRGVVDEHVVELDVGGNRPRRARRPRATGARSRARSPCRPGHRGSLSPPPGARRLERDPGDPLDLGDRVLAVVEGAVAVAPPLAEVDAAGELAHDQEIGAGDPLGRSGLASTSEGLGRTGRRFANRPRPLRRPSRPCSGRGASGSVRVPLRAADRAEQHGVRGAAGLEHLVGERRPVRVDRGAADEMLGQLEVADLLEQAPRSARRSPARSRRPAAGRSGAGSAQLAVRPLAPDVGAARSRSSVAAASSSSASTNSSRSSSGRRSEVRVDPDARRTPAAPEADVHSLEPAGGRPRSRRAATAPPCPRPREVPGRRDRCAGRAGKRSSPFERDDRPPRTRRRSPRRRTGPRSVRPAAARRGALKSRSWSSTQWKVAFEKTASTSSSRSRSSRSPCRSARRRVAELGARLPDHRGRARRRRSPRPAVSVPPGAGSPPRCRSPRRARSRHREREALEHPESPLLLRARDAVVGAGVPVTVRPDVALIGQSAVVAGPRSAPPRPRRRRSPFGARG